MTTNKGKTAFLFLLAVLMLVVSCPIKRLLQAESNVQVSSQLSTKWNGAEREGTAHKATPCCAQKQKVTLIKPAVGKQKLPAPDFVAAQNVQSGFALYYFLSGTKEVYTSSAASSHPSLPLFLQHRRLLI